MGIGIEFQEFCIELKKYGAEERVNISFCTGDLWSLSCSHAEFRAACCRGLGLVDPNDAPYPISQDDVDELCRKRMAEKTQRSAGHAADVLAAASRRLA